MPWKPTDAKRHTRKAKSSKSRRQWSHVANAALSRGASEGSAIRQANAVVKFGGRRGRKGKKMITGRLDAKDRRRKRGKKR